MASRKKNKTKAEDTEQKGKRTAAETMEKRLKFKIIRPMRDLANEGAFKWDRFSSGELGIDIALAGGYTFGGFHVVASNKESACKSSIAASSAADSAASAAVEASARRSSEARV